MTETEIVVTAMSLALILALAYYFFGPKKARQAEVRGDVQEIRISVKGGYSPAVIRVREGIPLRLIFDRQEASDCSSRIVFPDFRVSKSLPAFGTTTLEFTPDKSGEFGFACGMNMLHGTLIVEANGAGPVAVASEDESDGSAFAEAVGVGPRLEVEALPQAEFSLLGGGVNCPTCVNNIEAWLKDLPGVDGVHVNFGAERVTVQYDPPQISIDRIRQAIEEAGYHARHREDPGSQGTEDEEAAARREERRDLGRRVAVGAALTLPVLYAVMVGEFISEDWVPGLMEDAWFQLALISPVMPL